ncbi:replication protein [Salmonella enterica subsp. enterica serovar Infantis]|uniref:Replication protein n=6 Tax=Salmonella enterica TaxID=28901 RepID=A0A725FAP3_SALSE|nr:replication protein [Salmonella enterica]EAU3193623.1 replication protein [Salmonella enterica subsp. enterica serovar Cubana]EBC9397869.1 replication protein [Salmonella enterica subsp. enterica serovar Heidelberg]EBK1613546.1 replication protein [Salmonella enterica subsp. enterica serovar Give]EBL3750460.1 replication protein [Salmonella enterica subsp. enterica serovar Typhimurium]EBN5333918.1 replication protein [Salmonella enterica subsp. enterica serovar Uganda]EBS0345525.1 replicat
MENQKQGHFSLFRSLLSKEWAKDTAKLAMWIRLIGEASYKHRTVEFSGREWDLMPGELVTTAAIMGRKLRDQDGHEKSPQAVTRMINFFVKEGMITTKGTRFGTVISITNYGQYQEISPDEPCDKPSDNNKPSNGAALKHSPDEPCDKPSDEQNKKVVNKKVVNNNKTPLPPNGGGDGQVKPERRKAERIDYESFLNAYNTEVGDRLPHAVSVNEKRKRRLKKIIPQLKTPNVDGFRAYVRAFVHQARPFYFGDNDTGWTADFDYLLREDSLTGVREGKFADRGIV